MTEPAFECPKCNGTMNLGYLSDYSEHSVFIAKWIEGEPTPRTFLGITGTNVETHGRAMLDVRALRCEHCGFLELYAV